MSAGDIPRRVRVKASVLWAFWRRRWRDHWVTYWESQGMSEEEQMELALAEETRQAQAALTNWKERLRLLGYERLRDTYFDRPLEEFFHFEGTRYFVVTEACWDCKSGGDIRVFIELS